LGTPIEELDIKQVESCIGVFENTIEETNRVARQLREAGIPQSQIRMYLPDPEIYNTLEKLYSRLKELKEKNA
jgi:hypothetical protein